ncbi:MAG: DUF58 domain-containing protein [Roseiflexaceae bacterium]
MFRRNTVLSLALVLLLALAVQQTLLALLCALLLLTAGITALWSRWALRRVSYERQLSAQRAFPGDEIELTIRITNRKPLAVARLDMREMLPAGIELNDPDQTFDQQGQRMLQRTSGLGWYERVTWRYRLRCPQRGVYRFGPVQLEAGDPFGFSQNIQDIPEQQTLLVYPRLLPLHELGLPPRRPLGDLRARQLVRDPLRTVGVRDYHPDDPLKDIHWSATARVGTLQTRVYETTTAFELAIFLDLDTFTYYWEGVDPEQIERMISAAASLARQYLDEGYAVGLYVNGAPAQFEQLVQLSPSRSPTQLEHILDVLARLVPYSITPMARLLRPSAVSLPWGATVLLISCIAPPEIRAALARLRERGRRVAWLYMGADAPPTLPAVIVHHAPPAQDWRRRSAQTKA